MGDNFKYDHLQPPYRSKRAGIYAIINRDNLKIYIGSSVRLNHRWAEHRSSFALGNHGNRYLLRAFRKSPRSFELQVIEEFDNPNKETLLSREQFWIDFYQSADPLVGYNISPTAESCQGIKRDPEFVAKVIKSLSKPWTPERKAKVKALRALNQPRGWKWSEEAKRRHSELLKTIPRDPEAAKRAGLKNTGKKYPQRGRGILQISKKGEILKRYDAISYAAKELGVPECNIRQCLKHPTWTSAGCTWRDANG